MKNGKLEITVLVVAFDVRIERNVLLNIIT